MPSPCESTYFLGAAAEGGSRYIHTHTCPITATVLPSPYTGIPQIFYGVVDMAQAFALLIIRWGLQTPVPKKMA